MKKSMKLFLRIMPIVMVALVFVSGNVFAAPAAAAPAAAAGAAGIVAPTGGSAATGLNNLTGSIYQTITSIVQVIAILSIIIAGIRYMLASGDQKGELKKQTIGIVIGAVLVFAAIPVVNIIANTANQVIVT